MLAVLSNEVAASLTAFTFLFPVGRPSEATEVWLTASPFSISWCLQPELKVYFYIYHHANQ
jgi:hypothetical protein